PRAARGGGGTRLLDPAHGAARTGPLPAALRRELLGHARRGGRARRAPARALRGAERAGRGRARAYRRRGMKTPLRITFQGLDPSPALEERIRRKAAKLERFCDRITSCHVVVERPPAHKQHGGTYHVRIHLEVPGGRLDVAREPGRDQAHEDVYV